MTILGVDPGSARLGWTGSELPVPISHRNDPERLVRNLKVKL